MSRRLIVEALDDNLLVEAAAGTGKTTSIVKRMLNLIASGACEPQQLTAITFTRKAAAELRSRFLSALSDQLHGQQSTDNATARERFQNALDNPQQMFIGTIHSFCATLLRERPIEFGVDPNFRDMEADEQTELVDEAWQTCIADLLASNDPLIDQLAHLGLKRSQLRDSFQDMLTYRDIESWPIDADVPLDLEQCEAAVRDYVEHIGKLLPDFANRHESDELMEQYELIHRVAHRGWLSETQFFRIVELFDKSDNGVQSVGMTPRWPRPSRHVGDCFALPSPHRQWRIGGNVATRS